MVLPVEFNAPPFIVCIASYRPLPCACDLLLNHSNWAGNLCKPLGVFQTQWSPVRSSVLTGFCLEDADDRKLQLKLWDLEGPKVETSPCRLPFLLLPYKVKEPYFKARLDFLH